MPNRTSPEATAALKRWQAQNQGQTLRQITPVDPSAALGVGQGPPPGWLAMQYISAGPRSSYSAFGPPPSPSPIVHQSRLVRGPSVTAADRALPPRRLPPRYVPGDHPAASGAVIDPRTGRPVIPATAPASASVPWSLVIAGAALAVLTS